MKPHKQKTYRLAHTTQRFGGVQVSDHVSVEKNMVVIWILRGLSSTHLAVLDPEIKV